MYGRFNDTHYSWDYNEDDLTSEALIPNSRTRELTDIDPKALWDASERVTGQVREAQSAPDPTADPDEEYFEHDDVVPAEMYYHSPDYEQMCGGMFDTPMVKKDRKRRFDRERLLMDPGRDKLRCRKRAKLPSRIKFEQDRYIDQRLNDEGLTTPSEARAKRRAEMIAERDERAFNGNMVRLIIDLTGKGRSWAYDHLQEFKDNGIKATLISRSITPRRELNEGEGNAGGQCFGVYKSTTGPLPVREQVDQRDEIIQAPIDKEAVRAKLEADTAAFQAAGSEIEVLEPWYPPEHHCITIGGVKHIRPIPFDRWGR